MFPRKLIVLAAAGMLAGCTSSQTFQPLSGRSDSAELAAYAATTKYPSDVKPGADMQLAALFAPHSDKIRIVNFSDTAIRDARVWINGTYVYRVDLIPSHATVDLPRTLFYDSTGMNMDKVHAIPSKVEVQTGDKLMTLQTASYLG